MNDNMTNIKQQGMERNESRRLTEMEMDSFMNNMNMFAEKILKSLEPTTEAL